MTLDKKIHNKVLELQRNEITEHFIYSRLAISVKDKNNNSILSQISEDELVHYKFWKEFTGQDVMPNEGKINYYIFLAKLLGLSFALKLMESGEASAQDVYNGLANLSPKVVDVIKDEERHEKEVLNLINEEKLQYTGSVILGLNDALVELTGALSGFTLALGKTKLIALVGLITGIAAALSMAASEYLSTKDEGIRNPMKACIYTGIAYIVTVIFLVLPFFLINNAFLALAITVFFVVGIISAFTFYVSVAKGIKFKNRFAEMISIALGVAVINFVIGFFIKRYLNIDV